MIIENADELLDALHEARVRLVFHGHQHHAETGILADSGMKIIGAGSTTLKHGSNPPGFCTFELSPSSSENTLDIRLIERYQFDRALQKFRTS